MNKILVLILAAVLTSGCWAVAAGAGAEAGYIGAQEDRTASRTVKDQTITATVKSKLLADPDVSALSIDVDTDKGVVTLTGPVNSAYEADRAVEIAGSVSGVKSVRRRLDVAGTSGRARYGDEQR